MNIPVFDLHCDTALALLGKNRRECGSLKTNEYHIDLDRAGKFPGYAQCFACFTSEYYTDIKPVELFEREMVTILREVEKNSSLIRLAYNADDVEENRKNNIMSAILTIEGPAGFGYDPMLLQDLHSVGFRMTTLGWNDKNTLTGSHSTGGGLTDLGRDYVFEAQRLGMIIDTSHISDEGFWDIMDITDAPVIASHSNSRAVHNVTRNITDEMFLEICRTGGVVGINQYADFVGTDPDLDTLCDHVFHFLELDPDGKHIALGGDLDGCSKLVADFSGIQDYPTFADRLLARGLSESMLYDLFWNNAIGVMKRCCI
jgi:membrane dipeptidase